MGECGTSPPHPQGNRRMGGERGMTEQRGVTQISDGYRCRERCPLFYRAVKLPHLPPPRPPAFLPQGPPPPTFASDVLFIEHRRFCPKQQSKSETKEEEGEGGRVTQQANIPMGSKHRH